MKNRSARGDTNSYYKNPTHTEMTKIQLVIKEILYTILNRDIPMSLISAGGGGYGEKCPDGEAQEPGQNHLARDSGSKLSKTTLNYILCLSQCTFQSSKF
jgi:hypothetical protein